MALSEEVCHWGWVDLEVSKTHARPIFLSFCFSVFLPVYLPACLPVCLPVCLPTCLLSCLPACLPACYPICLMCHGLSKHLFCFCPFHLLSLECCFFTQPWPLFCIVRKSKPLFLALSFTELQSFCLTIDQAGRPY